MASDESVAGVTQAPVVHLQPLIIASPSGMLLYAIIFVSGAATLAPELLASRIMTPYFGVSLYIWTGILSITLVALALGYWIGGRFARRAVGPASAPRML